MMRDLNFYGLTMIKAFIAYCLAFLIPINGLILLVIASIFLDTVFAIYATIRMNGWSSYQSTKLFNIVVKTFFYLLSIIFAFMIDSFVITAENKLFGIDLIIAKFVTVFWVYIELKSIDETSQKLGNKSFYFTIKKLLEKAKALKKDINEMIN